MAAAYFSGVKRPRSEGGSALGSEALTASGVASPSAAQRAHVESKGVITYLLDIDGCLVNEDTMVPSTADTSDYLVGRDIDWYSKVTDADRAKLLRAIVEKNAVLLERIRKDVQDGYTVKIASGSRRQDISSDLANVIKSSTLANQFFYLGSLFEVLDLIAKETGAELDTASVIDVADFNFNGERQGQRGCNYPHPLGMAYDFGVHALKGDLEFFRQRFLLSSDSIRRSIQGFDDDSKVLQILAHVYANFDGDASKPFVCKFCDDRDDILARALKFFTDYPQALPEGVTVEFYKHMAADNSGAEMKPEVSVLQGTVSGVADANGILTYRSLIKDLVLAASAAARLVGSATEGDISALPDADKARIVNSWSSAIASDADAHLKSFSERAPVLNILAKVYGSKDIGDFNIKLADEKTGLRFFKFFQDYPELIPEGKRLRFYYLDAAGKRFDSDYVCGTGKAADFKSLIPDLALATYRQLGRFDCDGAFFADVTQVPPEVLRPIIDRWVASSVGRGAAAVAAPMFDAFAGELGAAGGAGAVASGASVIPVNDVNAFVGSLLC